MGIMLGNLTLEQIQRRCGLEFPDNVKEYLEKTWQHKADVGDGKEEWHGFDIPFCIYCGNIEMATFLFQELSKLDWSKARETPTVQYAQYHRLQEVTEDER